MGEGSVLNTEQNRKNSRGKCDQSAIYIICSSVEKLIPYRI